LCELAVAALTESFRYEGWNCVGRSRKLIVEARIPLEARALENRRNLVRCHERFLIDQQFFDACCLHDAGTKARAMPASARTADFKAD
jgi:hypothetical protein